MKTVFLGIFVTTLLARAQDIPSIPGQVGGLQSAQQTQQDLISTGQANLQLMQQMDQFNQLVLQQMQATGVDTNKYVLNIPPWDTWKVSSESRLELSVKSGPVKPGTEVRIKWRGGDYAAVYYTLDGWSPTLASTRYTGPITIDGTIHLQAVGINWNCMLGNACKDWTRSAVVDADYRTSSNSKAEVPSIVTDGLLRAGTVLRLKTDAEIRSDSAKLGDKVSLVLDQDVMVANTIAIPKGASAIAVLTKVNHSAGSRRPALLVLTTQSLHGPQARIELIGSETMEGKTGQNSEVAIVRRGMTLYAKVAADTSLQH